MTDKRPLEQRFFRAYQSHFVAVGARLAHCQRLSGSGISQQVIICYSRNSKDGAQRNMFAAPGIAGNIEQVIGIHEMIAGRGELRALCHVILTTQSNFITIGTRCNSTNYVDLYTTYLPDNLRCGSGYVRLLQ